MINIILTTLQQYESVNPFRSHHPLPHKATIHHKLSPTSVFVIRGARDCVLCVTRQRWAQIKGFCQVLIRSALMFVFQYQGLHDL